MRTLLAVLVATMITFGGAQAARAELETSASADVSVMSNYVWRGLKLSESWVVQPTLTVGLGPVSFNMWSNYDGDLDMGGAEGSTGKITETDVTISYSRALTDTVSLDAGYIYYELEGFQDTQEVFVSLGYDFVVSPSLTLYYDFDEGTGGFALLALGYSKELGASGATLDLGASMSYVFDNDVVGVDADGQEYSGLHNGELSASVNVPVKGMFYVAPKIAYTFPLSDDAEDAIMGYSYDGDEDTLYAGVSGGFGF